MSDPEKKEYDPLILQWMDTIFQLWKNKWFRIGGSILARDGSRRIMESGYNKSASGNSEVKINPR